jgi:hypothetical protein
MPGAGGSRAWDPQLSLSTVIKWWRGLRACISQPGDQGEGPGGACGEFPCPCLPCRFDFLVKFHSNRTGIRKFIDEGFTLCFLKK